MMAESSEVMLFGAGAWPTLEAVAPSQSDRRKQPSQEEHTLPKRTRKRPRATSMVYNRAFTANDTAPPLQQSMLDLPSPPPSSQLPDIVLPPGKRTRHWVIARIEDVFEQQIDSIAAHAGHLSISVRMRSGGSSSIRTLQFPGVSEKDAWRYTVVIRILELVHEALVADSITTKRDIYYRDPALFSTQTVVDRYVDNLACTFGVSRSLLNIAATAKGLIVGAFVIRREDGSVVNGRSEQEGTLISRLGDDDTVDVSSVRWVLVVEKEATFRSLVFSDFWKGLSSHGILVTAKGYPDIATRTILRSLALDSRQNGHSSLPVHALMDFDPDGVDILSTYKHGSQALAHETTNLELPSIQWLGVQSGDLGKQQDLHQNQGLLSLTVRDRRKANKMLEREPFAEDRMETDWRREIQVMLFINVKAEIQILEAQDGGLAGWLKRKGFE